MPNKTILSVPLVLALGACAQQPRHQEDPATTTATWVPADVTVTPADPPEAAAAPPKPSPSASLWERICDHLALTELTHPRIDHHFARFRRDPYHIARLSERARPFLHYIFEETVDRGLPAELVFLPMVESGFRPRATSPGRAGGLWQIRPATAEHLGLELDRWYDGRYDVRAATRAALDYLEYLHQRFDGDWLLALAAYNAGEGRVRQAMRANRRAGKPTDYWHLPLPRITRHYVPQILALARLAAASDGHGVAFREIEDAPYLLEVAVDRQISLGAVANALAVPAEDLYRLNACLKQGVTPPQTTYELLLPRTHAPALERALDALGLTAGEPRRRPLQLTLQSLRR